MKCQSSSSRRFIGLFCLIITVFLVSATLVPIYGIKAQEFQDETEDQIYKLIEKNEDIPTSTRYEIIEEYDSFLLIKSIEDDNQLISEDLLNVLNTDLNKIHLPRESIDTDIEPGIQESTESSAGLHLVQSIGPIKTEWRDALESNGSILGYYPENTYLMDLCSEKIENIEQKDFVRWVGEYETEQKISTELDGAEGNKNLNINIYKEVHEVLPELERFGSIDHYREGRISIEANVIHLDLIAEVEGVRWIEKQEEIELFNHDAQWTVQSGETDSRSVWEQGIKGTGQIVGVADTGIDYTHAQFRDPNNNQIGSDHRKIESYVDYAGDFDGHGHGSHVAGTIAGNDEIVENSQTHDGIAKNARLSKYDIGTDSGNIQLPTPISHIFEVAYEDGARIHSNSWGSSTSSYTSDSAEIDEFMWDNPEMLILYAAGNSGDEENTIASPATAKNALSVGASGVGDREVSQNDMASFSSRGPTDDGRLKPEVVAPGQGASGYYEGTDIVSAQSDGDPETLHNSYREMQGTSMACPAVAGTAALVREYFEEDHYPHDQIENPSAALVKAVLINSAQEITGEGAYANANEFPNNDQGFGRITLDEVLEFEGDQKNLRVHDEVIGLSTGESESYTINIEDSSEPFEVTLAYTDYPGEPGSSNVLVNDLNLEVISPSGEEYKGNVFEGMDPAQSTKGGELDDTNPIQNVLRLEPEVGEWKIQVTAQNTPQAPQPYALSMSGNFEEEQEKPIEASFDHEPVFPKMEEEVQFSDTSYSLEGEIDDWYWDFGDGSTSTEQNPIHIYEEPEIYDLVLTIEDTDGDSDTVIDQIKVEEPEYCEVEGGNTNYEYITNVKFNGIDRDSGDDGGYADHTDSVSDPLEPGESYELSVTMITSGFTNYATVVIDWSQDYLLCNEEVIKVGHGSNDPSTVSTEITVPENVETGETRMRVMNQYDDYHLDPCENQNFGETEDYTVKIGGEETQPEGPEANFDYKPDDPVQNETVEFTDESILGDGDIVEWFWYFDDGFSSIEQNPTHSYGDEGTFTVELKVTDENGLSDTAFKEVKVEAEIEDPEAEFTFDPEEPLEEEAVNFYDQSSSDGVIVSWSWELGDGKSSEKQNPTHSYDDAGIYEVILTITDENDLSDSFSDEVYVQEQLEPPIADFDFDPDEPKEEESIQFNDLSIGGDGDIVDWSWDFGDGSTSTEQSPSNIYENKGTYTVELTVTDKNELSDTVTKEIIIKEQLEEPIADFIFDPEEPEKGETVEFADESTSTDGEIISWNWDFGDGNTALEQHPNHLYQETDTYTVELTITDDNDLSDTKFLDITVTEKEDTGEYCEVEGGDTSWGEYIKHVEFNGIDRESEDDGGYADHTDSVSNPLKPGETYELSVKVGTGGYTSYVSVVIDWSRNYELTDEDIIEVGYGNDTPQTLTTEITVPEDAEEGKTRMRVMQEFNRYHSEPCEDQTYGETEDYTVKIGEDSQLENPEANFSFKPEDPLQHETVEFTDESTEGDGEIVEWSWKFDDVDFSTERNPKHSFEDEGYHTVELVVRDEYDLSDTTSREINIESLEGPAAAFDYTPQEPYEDEIVQFTDETTEGDGEIIEWSWHFGNGESSSEQNPEFFYEKEGKYLVELMVTDDNGLLDTSTEEITVKYLEGPEAIFDFEPAEPKKGETVEFTDDSVEGHGDIVSWSWDFGDGNTALEQHPNHLYQETDTYTVELTITDDNDLSDTKFLDITVTEKEDTGKYCEVEGGDTSWGEYIKHVEFNGIDRESEDDGGYADHTDSVSNPLKPGETYELSVKVGTGGYTSYVSVVIDWSQNYELTDEDIIEVGYGNDTPQTLTTEITVPEDAEEGKTRMRVMQEFNRYHTEPCEDQNYGETEDYTVKIETQVESDLYSEKTDKETTGLKEDDDGISWISYDIGKRFPYTVYLITLFMVSGKIFIKKKGMI